MSAYAETATERGSVFFLGSQAGAVASATSSPEHYHFICVATARVETLEEHLAGLPTLDDLLGELRAKHAGFDEAVARAHDEAYARSLALVHDGEMTRLHAERLRAQLTQGELAERAGLRQPNVSRLERVGAPMSVRTAKRLAAALGLEDYRVLLP
ncbi:MAG: helix-turn-helix domain-containing protein [Thermoanaerobaculaceae bacterium]|jgi:hypothetical protein|nr:helix-turn-helix domain-containing protein [Thermoanaerobaculaceae bacterium]